MGVESKTRDQLNISLGGDLSLARKLRQAEEATGQSRAQIARSVLDTFLETWLAAEEAKKRIIDAARLASQTEAANAVILHDLGTLRPRHRDDADGPIPGYWQAVESRRPTPPAVVARYLDVPVRDTVPPRPPTRALDPAPVFDETAGDELSD